MCLSTIKQTFRKPNDRMKVGYKVFKKYNCERNDPVYTNIYFDTYNFKKMGDSCTAEARGFSNEVTVDGKRYDPLFHIFSSLDGAQKWRKSISPKVFKERGYVICRVIAWDIRYSGVQSVAWVPKEGVRRKVPCFIAKHYRLMEEKNNAD